MTPCPFKRDEPDPSGRYVSERGGGGHICFCSAPKVMKVTFTRSQFPKWAGFGVQEEGKTLSLRRAKSFQDGPITLNIYSGSQNSFQCVRCVRSPARRDLEVVWHRSWNVLLWLQSCSRSHLAAGHDTEAHFPWDSASTRLALLLLPCFHLPAFPLLRKTSPSHAS